MRGLWLLLGLPLVPAALAQSTIEDDKSLLWGPYRPNLYFGMRPRIPQSLMTGMLWFGAHDFQSVSRSRHSCEQGDNLDSYTWTEFDPRRGGTQVIKDSLNNVKLTTELIKVPGGDHGGSWAVRIRGEPINPEQPSRPSVVFYAGLEGLGGLEMESDENENGVDGPVKFAGSTPELDEFTLRIVDGPDNGCVENGPFAHAFQERICKTHLAGFRAQPGEIWKAKEYILQNLITKAKEALQPYQDPSGGYPDPSYILQLSDEIYSGSNLFAVQKTFDGPFQFDVFFESASAKEKLDSSILDRGIAELSANINQRFTNTFPIKSGIAKTDSVQNFSKAVTANLMGGVGYFYGTSIVDKGFAYEWDEEDAESDDDDDEGSGKKEKGAKLTEPRALLTATPSRSFFPRGFYWDEGFHLVHIGSWDNDFALEILKDWIGLIDENGWVGREQILGEEARSKVPAEFQTQVPTNANPPTLAMAVTAFIARFKAVNPSFNGPSDAELGMDFGLDPGAQAPLGAAPTVPDSDSKYLTDPEAAMSFLRSIYAPLKRHYEWFRRTQRGQIKQYGRQARSRTEGYRWRGRSEQHVLTSGMDDYPRGPPSSGELHLDLISWMAFFSRTMREISTFIGETEDAASFGEIEKAIIDNIDDLHWNDEQQMYCDVGVNDDDESYHVCNKGYLSIFPLMLSVLPPDSPHLGPILDLLSDPKHLWSPYGLRSLSASHPDFGQGENYWKGPIWMPMNYLTLSALHKTYAAHDGPHRERAQQIYTNLRENVINNVFKEYERTGYVWEQYDANNGEGRRSHPFTGWTSMVTLIISEVY